MSHGTSLDWTKGKHFFFYQQLKRKEQLFLTSVQAKGKLLEILPFFVEKTVKKTESVLHDTAFQSYKNLIGKKPQKRIQADKSKPIIPPFPVLCHQPDIGSHDSIVSE